MENSLQIIVSVVGVGVVLLLALAGAAWRLGSQLGSMEGRIEARLDRVEDRIGDLGAGIRSLNQQIASIVGLLSNTFRYFHRSQVISDEEYHDSAGQITRMLSEATDPLVNRLTRDLNPLTSEDAQRFRELVNKARRGEWFTRTEVEHYDRLIRIVRAEHPDDPSIWPLVALGAFLSGLYVGQRQEEE